MSDITINSDESQDKKQKMTPIVESSIIAESQKFGLPTTVFQIWQGYMDEDRTFYSVNENTILETRNV